jgi:hypothetical protein
MTLSRGSGGPEGGVGWAGVFVSVSIGAVGGGVVLPSLVVVVCCIGWGVFLVGEDVAGWGEWVGVLRLGHLIGEGGR